MKYTDLHYQIAVNQLNGIGSVHLKKMLETVEDLREIFHCNYKNLSEKTGILEARLKKMQRAQALKDAEEIFCNIQEHDIETTFYTDDDFPRRLKQCADPPALLYKQGKIDLNDARFVAVVGTRSATEYGRRICKKLVQSFVDQDIVVVSGLAYGIDVEMHHHCLKLGVPTIGVLAHGLDSIYPYAHRHLAREMCFSGGLLSEYPPSTLPEKPHFPMRNRIVAGMCDATIVVESSARGGSLITGNLANDYSRDVFAFPGSIFQKHSEGCNNLIANNKAHLIQSGTQFLNQMGWEPRPDKSIQKSLFEGLSAFQKKMVNIILEKTSVSLDWLAQKLEQPIATITVEILQLEMEGVVKSLPGNRCTLAW